MRYGNSNIEVETSIKDKHLTFGVKDPAIIFDILTNRMYGKPLQTCIQEYICNARDAHREAGIEDKPIKVVLPTNIEPTLLIIDFGIGISKKRMKEVFVFLGESSKRDSDLETGGFGIGAKSGWAYTDSFGIICVFRNVKRTYLAFLGDKGIGKLDLLSEVKVKEPNSTTISLPIRPEDFHNAKEAVLRATTLWDVPPTISPKNGEAYHFEPEIAGEGWKFGGFEYTPSNKNLVVVSDGIPYPCPDIDGVREMFRLDYGDNLLIEFETGELDLAVNREGVQATDRSIEAIKQKAQQVVADAQAMMDHELGNIKDFATFLKRTCELNRKMRFVKYARPWENLTLFPQTDGSLRYDLPLSFEVRKYSFDHRDFLKYDRSRYSVRKAKSISFNDTSHILYDDKFLSRLNNRKLRHYAETKGTRNFKVIIPLPKPDRYGDSIPHEDYLAVFEEFKEMTFIPLSSIKNPRKSKAGKVQLTIWDGGDKQTDLWEHDDLKDSADQLTWCHKDNDSASSQYLSEFLYRASKVVDIDFPTQVIYSNVINTKKIVEAGVPHYKDVLKMLYPLIRSQVQMSDFILAQSINIGINDWWFRVMLRGQDELLDPTIQTYLKIYKDAGGSGKERSRAWKLYEQVLNYLNIRSRPMKWARICNQRATKAFDELEEELKARYWLLTTIEGWNWRQTTRDIPNSCSDSEIVNYMNRRYEDETINC